MTKNWENVGHLCCSHPKQLSLKDKTFGVKASKDSI